MYMTRKLYDEDSFATQFTATVLSCEKGKHGWLVVTDATLFFPTEGGQSFDTGLLGNQRVTDVLLQPDGTIVHQTDGPVSGTISGVIDFEPRFRKMQNHTGEHILSGLIYRAYGYENVGFHLGDTEVTMDVGGVLTAEQIEALERQANEVIWKDLPVTACYPDEQTLSHLSFRSKKDSYEHTRIVTIESVDCCACCAPHVRSTGQVGQIKILSFASNRGGTRLFIACGRDALDYAADIHRQIKQISAALKAPKHQTAEAVLSLQKENERLQFELIGLKRSVLQSKVESLPIKKGNLCYFGEDLSRDDRIYLLNLLKEKCDGLCAVLSGNDAVGYAFVLSAQTPSLQKEAADLMTCLNGRGGGQKGCMQGVFYAKKQQILTCFNDPV